MTKRLLPVFLIPVLLLHSAPSAGAADAGAPSARSGADFGPGGVYARIPPRDEFGRDQLAMFLHWNPDPVGRHRSNLRLLHPSLAAVVRRTQVAHPELPFVIGSGKRDPAHQRQALRWGWSKTPHGLHQSGEAVDLWPLDAAGRVHFDPGTQILIGKAMMKAAAELGVRLRWGGVFQSFKNRDRSHFELVSP